MKDQHTVRQPRDWLQSLKHVLSPDWRKQQKQ